MSKITASCKFHNQDLTDIPVLNPGDWFGKAWLLEIGGSYTPLFLIVEADNVCDAIDELSDNETYGNQIHVPDSDLGDYPEDDRHYDGSGRVIDLDHVMIHGREGCDLPTPFAITAMDCLPRASTLGNFRLGNSTDTTDPGAKTNTTHREVQIMPDYEVIVGNVGSVYYGKSRVEALKTYRSYIQSSRELVGSRAYGEDVTLVVDAEIERQHIGHLEQE
jgi:hypothetical protein